MSKSLGEKGESAAAEFLRDRGYTILARNFRSRGGELDIIAMKDHVLHFIEVKSRKNTLYGEPAEYVTPAKIRRMVKAIEYYLYSHRLYDEPMQIDVIAITAGRIDFIEDAVILQ